jgi:hypothetical protein
MMREIFLMNAFVALFSIVLSSICLANPQMLREGENGDFYVNGYIEYLGAVSSKQRPNKYGEVFKRD